MFEKLQEDDFPKITAIANRAVEIAEKQIVGGQAVKVKPITFMIDLATVHTGTCPLRLDEMMKADDFNLAHDVFGINRHLNHDTGELQDCFIPRFAEK